MVALHTAIAIVLAIGLIIRFKVDPVISLILASLYLGLASGVGFAGTIEAITVGFGEIMTEVGLLIGFGVLIGALLHATGAFHRLVDVLVRAVGATRLPYALSTLLSTVLPSIYVDVQVVLAAPVARSASPYIGRNGLPLMASALGAGIFAGYVFVIPGLAAISIAGLLDVPLGTWLLFGIVIGPLTAIITSLIMRLLLRGGFWKPESDEDVDEAMAEQEAHETAAADADEGRPLPLVVLLLPILVPLLMIAFGAFAELFGLLQLLHRVPRQRQPRALRRPRGCLPAVPRHGRARAHPRRDGRGLPHHWRDPPDHRRRRLAGCGDHRDQPGQGACRPLPGRYRRTRDPEHPAGVVHRSTAAPGDRIGVGRRHHRGRHHRTDPRSLGVAPVVIGLAIASGAMFALQVNSNFFWMFKALLGLSTKGTLKTLTVATSIASVVSLPMVIVVSLFA